MTNTLIIGVALLINATNTTQIKTNIQETPFDPTVASAAFFFNQNQERREKWVKTVIQREDKLTFEWNGKPVEVVQVTGISTNIVHMKIKQEWEEVK